MSHRAVDLGKQFAGLPDQVGFDLQSVGQAVRVAHACDLTDLIDRLGQMRVRIGPLGMVEREPADEFAIELVCKIASASDILLKVILERNVAVVGPVVDVQKLDLADRRADARYAQAVLFLQVQDVLDPLGVKLHDVLDPPTRIDESKRVVA